MESCVGGGDNRVLFAIGAGKSNAGESEEENRKCFCHKFRF
jgi:hypothetical protein